MKARARELARKREGLQLRCAAQRDELGQQAGLLEFRLAKVDRALGFARRAFSLPVLISAAVVLGFLLGPRKLIRVASRGMFVISAARRLARH